VWHNPRLLNIAAGFLTALGLMLLTFTGSALVLRSTLFPMREVTVRGALAHTTHGEIERVGQGAVAGNFFGVDLAGVRGAFERLPWVRRVDVRRVWPDRLEVTLEEHVALARWDGGGAVNTFGERFAAQADAQLPLFAAPAGSEAEVTRRYRLFAERLASLGLHVERVLLSPRYAWQLSLANGLQLVLGRDAADDPVEARLARFVAAYPSTVGRAAGKHDYVDLRYTNGFALRVPGAERAAGSDSSGRKG
jgi:cell division protein FtsQ